MQAFDLHSIDLHNIDLHNIDLHNLVLANKPDELEKITQCIVGIAESAAIEILSIYAEDNFEVAIKSDNSPVTRADLLADKVIVKALQKLCPDVPILSEESHTKQWSVRKNWPLYWLIDPLDGTKEFVDRNGEFTINIALIWQGKAIIGVVQAPVSGDVYFATHSTSINENPNNSKIINNQQPTAYKKVKGLECEKIQVRSVPVINGQQHFTLAIGRGCISKPLKQLFLTLHNTQTLKIGSALKTCLIAEGKADLYPRFGNTSEWDTAAAQCILECAGGQVTDMQLKSLRYNTKDCLINPEFLAFGDKSVAWSNFLNQQ